MKSAHAHSQSPSLCSTQLTTFNWVELRATLNRLAETTDISSQRISDTLNVIVAITNLANATNGAVDLLLKEYLLLFLM